MHVQDLRERVFSGLVKLLVQEAYEATSGYLMNVVQLPLNK